MCLWYLYNPRPSRCCILSETGLLHLVTQNVTLTALFVEFLSCLPGLCVPHRGKKKWDVLLVRQKVKRVEYVYMFCFLLVYFEYYLRKGHVGLRSPEIGKCDFRCTLDVRFLLKFTFK